MPNLIVSAVSTFDNKGLKKGKKEISAFDKNVQSLGKTFAKVFGTIAVANFAKNAVNAFIDSEKAAAKLRTTVSNLGLAFEQPGIEQYLDKLSLQFGIVDESLIPGFQRLLIATKDVAQAQSLFETALNVSAGTGKDLTAVSTSLSKAYMGDNAALGKLGVGLSKAQLKSASFLEIKRALDVNFAGQAAAAVEGYAGSMAKLTVAVDKSKEAIGKGLLDALAALSASKDIDTFTAKMVNAAEKIGNAFRTVGDVIGLLNPNASVKVGGKFLRKSNMNAPRLSPATSRAILLKQEVTQIKTGVTLRKAENEQLKKKTAVDQLRDKFDLERIGLTAALNAATDEETKLRLKAQLAILDNNEALAKKILAEMEATNKLKEFTDALAASTNKYDAMISGLIAQFRTLGLSLQESMALAGMSARYQAQADAFGRGASGGNTAPLSTDPYDVLIRQLAPQLNTQYGLPAQEAISLATMSARYQAQADAITINIQAGGDKMSQAIAESIQIANRNGYDLTGAGQLP